MMVSIAVDDYFEQIARTRPWTVAHEQAVLHPFCDWLGMQPEQATLDAVSPIFATSYARDRRLSHNGRHELAMALHNLCLWANCEGLIGHNPFSLVTLVC